MSDRDRAAILARRARLVALSLAGAGLTLADQRSPPAQAASGSASARGAASPPGSASGPPPASASASAPPPSDEDRRVAKELFREAVAAYEAGDKASAIERMTRAYRLYPQPLVALRLARMHEEAGRGDRALPLYEQAQEAASLKPEQRAQAAERAKELRRLLPRLRVRYVHPPNGIALDGEPFTIADNESVWLAPGTHRIEAFWSSSNRVSSITVALRPGEETLVELSPPPGAGVCLSVVCLEPPPPPPVRGGGCGCGSPGAKE